MVWLKFFLCLIVILFAGTKLAKYGDAIAEKTGLGRMWVGLLFLAVVTAMPELTTGVSAAALVKTPDLTFGTLLGSCLFNLTILAVLDVLHRRIPILSKVSRVHVLSAGMGILLVALVAGSILAGEKFSNLALGWVGLPSILILVLYLVGAVQIFRSEQKRQLLPSSTEALLYENLSKRVVYLGFILAAMMVIGAGIWLSFIGDEMAEVTGWGASFIGSLFLAITTSMPELVVTVAAVRLGAMDMAVADILGANMLDVVAITWADLFYTEGPILFQPRSLVSGAHLTTALLVIIMSLLVIVGLTFRQKRKTFVVISWYGPLFIGLYLFGAYSSFALGSG